MGFSGGSVVKNPPAMQETRVQSLGLQDPLERRKWQLIPVFLPGKCLDGEAWGATVPEATESQTRVSEYTTTNVLYLEVSCFKKSFPGTS